MGWSIIALTVGVRAPLLPLAFKQMHSIQKLRQVVPQLKAIQAKYKDDEQRPERFARAMPRVCLRFSGNSTRRRR